MRRNNREQFSLKFWGLHMNKQKLNGTFRFIELLLFKARINPLPAHPVLFCAANNRQSNTESADTQTQLLLQ